MLNFPHNSKIANCSSLNLAILTLLARIAPCSSLSARGWILLDKIFDRFYSANQSRSREHRDYGLGLAIAKSIVEQRKGKIYAKSVLNESTSLYVQLP
ncbi:cell wall metabolism sensor histidine kinase WalK [Paenibacillus sp. HWE-109]|uniref:ATP-binding protein n=1 Tax=Paenibacillus sp. HWE-109 TaxID=1306526 RepID=UPI001EE081D6|nr:ATP-binding protein [Paenibacillus sp. HWE-109]UKS25929.1 cell wall metabolism sensor histidine kinase WalK [Paenibacillus sp. HWE-109]